MKTAKKSIAIFLTLLMIFTALPMAVGAADEKNAKEPSSVVATAEDENAAVPDAEDAEENPEAPEDPLDLFDLDLPEPGRIMKAPAKRAPSIPIEDTDISFDWDENTKTLTFTGEGPMPDFELNTGGSGPYVPETPWDEYYDKAEKVVIGENITTVGACSFVCYSVLSEVVLPSTLTSIGEMAFYMDGELAQINLPEGLTSIGEGAFFVNKLSNVTIPAGVTTLTGLFNYNTVPLNVTFNEGLLEINDCFESTVISNLVIPASLQTFNGGGGSDNILNTQTLVNNSENAAVSPYLSSADEFMLRLLQFELKLSIMYESLYYRTGAGLSEEDIYPIYLEAYNELLGTNYTDWFELEAALNGGTLPPDAQAIVDQIDGNDIISVPLSTISISCLSESAEHDALRENGYTHYLIDRDGELCDEVLTLKCGDNMTWTVSDEGELIITGKGEMYNSYKGWLFRRDEISSIRFVEDGGSITRIGQDAFRGFSSIDSLEIPAGVTSFGYNWISECRIGNFIIPAGFTFVFDSNMLDVGSYGSIDSFTVAEGNPLYFAYNGSLYKNEHSTCYLLKYAGSEQEPVIYPQTDVISAYSFREKNSITSVTIPASVNTVEFNAFYYCRNLSSVTIAPGSAALSISLSSFNYCSKLAQFVADPNDTRFTTVDGVLFTKDMKTLIAVPFTIRELVLPESVERIVYSDNAYADGYNIGLTKLTINNADFDFQSQTNKSTSAFVMGDFNYSSNNANAPEIEIIGHTGSQAERYAMIRNYTFTSIEGITIESVDFDFSGVPATGEIFNSVSYSNWNITGTVNYSDGSTRTIRYGTDFKIYYKEPGRNYWSENSRVYFDYAGDYILEARYGSFKSQFTINVPDIDYHYEFDTSEAVTEIRQFDTMNDYQVWHQVQTGEYSWMSFYDSILGVKLNKVYDNGEIVPESMDSYINITYGNNENWWTNIFNDELGSYTVTFNYSRNRFNVTASIDVQVVPGDFAFEANFDNVLSSVGQFESYTGANWGATASLTRSSDGTVFDISSSMGFNYVVGDQWFNNTLDTNSAGTKTIRPYVYIYQSFPVETDEGTEYRTINISREFDPIDVTVTPDANVDHIRLVVDENVEIEKEVSVSLLQYVKAYKVFTDETEEEITDLSGIIFDGWTSNGGHWTATYVSLYSYGDYADYTITFGDATATMTVTCVQLYSFDVQATTTEFEAWPDSYVTASDFGFTVTMTKIATGETSTATGYHFNNYSNSISTPGTYSDELYAYFEEFGQYRNVGSVEYTVIEGPTFELRGIPAELTVDQYDSYPLSDVKVYMVRGDEETAIETYFNFNNENGEYVNSRIYTINAGSYTLQAYAYAPYNNTTKYIAPAYIQNNNVSVTVEPIELELRNACTSVNMGETYSIGGSVVKVKDGVETETDYQPYFRVDNHAGGYNWGYLNTNVPGVYEIEPCTYVDGTGYVYFDPIEVTVIDPSAPVFTPDASRLRTTVWQYDYFYFGYHVDVTVNGETFDYDTNYVDSNKRVKYYYLNAAGQRVDGVLSTQELGEFTIVPYVIYEGAEVEFDPVVITVTESPIVYSINSDEIVKTAVQYSTYSIFTTGNLVTATYTDGSHEPWSTYEINWDVVDPNGRISNSTAIDTSVVGTHIVTPWYGAGRRVEFEPFEVTVTPAESEPIALNSTVEANSELYNSNVYTFTPPADGNYTFKTADCQKSYLRIYLDGAKIKEVEINTHQLNTTVSLSAENTYDIVIYKWAGNANTFTLSLNDVHDLTFVPAAAGVDCEHTGTIACYECSICGGRFADENAAEAIDDVDDGTFGAHDLTFVPAEEGTCEHTGTIAYYECSVCGDKFADESATEPIENVDDGVYGSHDLTFVPAEEGTDCEHTGTIAYYECSVCGDKFADESATEPIENIDDGVYGSHDLTFVPAEEGTDCEHTGTIAYYECSVCGDKFADESATEPIENVDDGVYGSHDLTRTAAKPATCKAEGNIEYWTCSVCGDKFSDANGTTKVTNVSIPKAAHSLTKTDAVPATCTADGNIAFWTCSGCGKIFSDAEGTNQISAAQTVDAAKGHNFVVVSRVEPSCTQEGLITSVCLNDPTHTKTQRIDKVGHKDDDHDGYCDFGCGTQIGTPGGENICHWCGKVHSSNFWQKIVAWFHNIFARLFGAKY